MAEYVTLKKPDGTIIYPQSVIAQVADGSITTDMVADGAITNAQIASNTITAESIAAGAVSSSELATNAVTTAKIANKAVTFGKIATAYSYKTKAATTTAAASIATADFTVPTGQGGVYFASATWAIDPTGTYDYRVLDFVVNNVRGSGGVQSYLNQRHTLANSQILTLSAGDKVHAAVWANSANMKSISGSFCIFRIA